jgi:ATP-dependent RNA helicase RhlE
VLEAAAEEAPEPAVLGDLLRRDPELADGLLNNPQSVEVARRNTASELVDAVGATGREGRKRTCCPPDQGTQLVPGAGLHPHQARRQQARRAAAQGRHRAAAIHGNKSQNARTRALAAFKEGSLQVLVATDIAARGIDIDQLPHVVNFELPNVPEDYVHRIGRTGRAGATGEALSLVAAGGAVLGQAGHARTLIPPQPDPGVMPGSGAPRSR